MRGRVRATDRQRLRQMIADETEAAAVFGEFMSAAYNRGYAMKLTVEVDGVGCEVGLLCSRNPSLMEFLANWACAEKIRAAIRLEEFDKEGDTLSGGL
jgi:hypothetical protein